MMIYQAEGAYCGHKGDCKCKENHGHHHYKADKKYWNEDKEQCPDRVKGFNLCKKLNELRCFKQCQPISQPCDGSFYNYFTSRTNYEFSGLVVITNTGNPTSGCSMRIIVVDRAGTSEEIVVNAGASFPVFVEGLTSLFVACDPNNPPNVNLATCSGEIIFDLEYCATKVCL